VSLKQFYVERFGPLLEHFPAGNAPRRLYPSCPTCHKSFMREQKIDRTKELDITSATYLLFAINIALEKDDWKKITFDDVYAHLDSGDLIPFLDAHLKSIDLSLFGPDEPQGRLLLAALRHVAPWFKERERRKTGIKQNGVCLVIAWIGQVIQCGQWKIDPQFLSDEPDLPDSQPPQNLIDFPRNQ